MGQCLEGFDFWTTYERYNKSNLMKASLKTQVSIFLILTFALSWVQQYMMIAAGRDANSSATFFLMWTPGLVGLFLSIMFGGKLKDIGFRLGSWRYYLLAYAVPAGTAILILASLIAFGFGKFEMSASLIEKKGGVAPALLAILVNAILIGGFFGFVSGLGEEIGWRGFLHSKLMDLRIPHPFLITGAIWAVWHWPLILFADYATSDKPVLSLLMFSFMAMSLSVFMGWLRERSGSVFTSGLVHGTHNLWIQAIYPAFLAKGPLDPYLGGESGFFNLFFYFCVAAFIYRKFLVRGIPVLTKES